MRGDIYQTEDYLMSTTIKTIARPQVRFTVSATIPRQTFEQLSFWKLLTPAEQSELADETSYLFAAHKQLGISEAGRRLLRIQTKLEPYKGAFAQLLNLTPHFSSRTGYRYITDYKCLLTLVGEPVMEVMVKQGFRLFKATRKRPLGVYTEAFEALRSNSELPPDSNLQAALRYVKKLELQHEKLKADPRALLVLRRRIEKAGNPALEARRNSEEFLTHQATTLLNDVQRRLPPERRDAVLENIIGYQLTRRGIASKTFRAMAIPYEEVLAPIPA